MKIEVVLLTLILANMIGRTIGPPICEAIRDYWSSAKQDGWRTALRNGLKLAVWVALNVSLPLFVLHLLVTSIVRSFSLAG